MKAIINWVKRNWPASKSSLLELEIELIKVRGKLESSIEDSSRVRATLDGRVLALKHEANRLDEVYNHLNQKISVLTETCISYVISEFTRENTPQIAEGESYNEWVVTNVSVNTNDATDIHFEYTLKFDESEVTVREVSKQAIQTALDEKTKS